MNEGDLSPEGRMRKWTWLAVALAIGCSGEEAGGEGSADTGQADLVHMSEAEARRIADERNSDRQDPAGESEHGDECDYLPAQHACAWDGDASRSPCFWRAERGLEEQWRVVCRCTQRDGWWQEMFKECQDLDL